MPRSPRFFENGATYHVTCRGNNRELIFFNDLDYQQYLRYLAEYQAQFGFKVLGYCLMPNHVHLLLQPSVHATLSQIMLCLSGRYTQYSNRRHERVGHLFQGRFHSRLIKNDQYLLAVSRYVHLNPTKALLCQEPEDYPWSSYGVYCGRAESSVVVETALIFQLLAPGQSEPACSRLYQLFVKAPTTGPGEEWEPDAPRPRGRPKKGSGTLLAK